MNQGPTGACAFCKKPGVAFMRVYQHRRKVSSFPVCVQDAVGMYLLQEFGQDTLRTLFARILVIRKGTIPRIKIAYTQ